MTLYRSLGLTARKAAEIVAEIVEMIDKRLQDDEMLKNLSAKFSENDLIFAAFTLGRIVGMSFAIKDQNSAELIISDFGRYLKILHMEGKEKLKKVIENEILDEVYREIERVRDVV